MNKLLSSIIGGFLGASMITAVGVGIGVGSQPLKEAKAANVTVTKTASELATEHKWTTSTNNNQVCYSSFALDEIITISTSGSPNCGSFWGSDWRLYQAKSGDINISASSGYTLVSATLTYGVQNNGRLYDGNTGYASDATISLTNLSTKTLTVGSTNTGTTNAQVRITTFSVTYVSDSGSGGDTPTEESLTYQHVFNAKPSTGNNISLSGISWNIEATNLGSYNSTNYAGVQVGTGKLTGSIQLTSSNTWGNQNGSSYKGYTNITEIRLWLNAGNTTTLSTLSTTIGGKACTKDKSSVTKNSKAGSDWTKTTKITFTPGDADTGTVVINVAHDSSLAFYICALEIDCDLDSSVTPEPTISYTDVITLQTTGLGYNQTNYDDWSNKKLSSHAVYAGHTSSSNGNIQFRSTKTNTESYTNRSSGIVSTTSGGQLSKVKVTFSNESATGRTIDVYGNTTAYTSADDLASAAKSGTAGDLIGEIVYDGSQTVVELVVSSPYTYVGLHSKSGAIYIEKIEITWDRTTEVPGVDVLQVSSNPTQSTYAVGDEFDPAGLVVQVKFVGQSSFEDTPNYTLSIDRGYVFKTADSDASNNYEYEVTVTSVQDTSKTTTFTLVVNPAYPVKLIRTTPAIYKSGMKLNEGTGRFTAVYTDENVNVTNIGVGSANTTLVTNSATPETIDVNSPASDYDGVNVKLQYTDQGHTVSYTFKIVVDDDLMLDHFDEVPNYIIKNQQSSLIEAHYVSFVGEPQVSFEPMENSGLTVTRDTTKDSYDPVSDVGSFYFHITGSKKGQYSIIVTITHGNLTSSKSLSILVRDAEEGHEGTGRYELIDSVSDITDGKYVIAAYIDGSYYGLDGVLNGSKYGSTELTVSNDTITSDDYHPVTIEASSDNYVIKNTLNDATKYIAHQTGKTNMFESTNEFLWTISKASTGGTFSITSSDNRGLIARSANDEIVFRSYVITNVNGTEYFNVELFKYVNVNPQEDEANEAFELVKQFVNDNMHMTDISISDESDTGACRGTNGYYLTAKAAWYAMVDAYTGSQDLVEIFRTKFPDAYQRYITWAEKNGDSQPFVGSTIVPAKAITNITDNGSAPVMVIAISLLTTFSISGYFGLKKKRLHK